MTVERVLFNQQSCNYSKGPWCPGFQYQRSCRGKCPSSAFVRHEMLPRHFRAPLRTADPLAARPRSWPCGSRSSRERRHEQTVAAVNRWHNPLPPSPPARLVQSAGRNLHPFRPGTSFLRVYAANSPCLRGLQAKRKGSGANVLPVDELVGLDRYGTAHLHLQFPRANRDGGSIQCLVSM